MYSKVGFLFWARDYLGNLQIGSFHFWRKPFLSLFARKQPPFRAKISSRLWSAFSHCSGHRWAKTGPKFLTSLPSLNQYQPFRSNLTVEGESRREPSRKSSKTAEFSPVVGVDSGQVRRKGLLGFEALSTTKLQPPALASCVAER